MESNSSIVNDNTLKNLSDKSIEKRKQAATEIGNITDGLYKRK